MHRSDPGETAEANVCMCVVSTGSTPAAHTKNEESPHIPHRMRNALEFLDYALKEWKIDLHLGYVSYKLKILPKDADPHVPLPFKKNSLGFYENANSSVLTKTKWCPNSVVNLSV